MKKGQGLSITTIIVAALGLVILVVLIAIVGGRFQLFGKGLGEQTGMLDCAKAGGKPIVIFDCDNPLYGNYGEIKSGKLERIPANKVCCAPAA